MNAKEYAKLEEQILGSEKLYIYGAGIVAYGAYEAIKELMNRKPEAFLVSDRKGNPEEIDGVPVKSLLDEAEALLNSFVLIATPEEYHGAIAKDLEKLQVQGTSVQKAPAYEKLTSHLEYVLMGKYLSEKKGFSLVEELAGCEEDYSAGCVYMATSHHDKILKQAYECPKWVKKIQVGAVLTEERICELTDEIKSEDEKGPSLSYRNPLYGELTATYWMWKQAEEDILGLFHYRRVLELPKGTFKALANGKVDVILPLPFVCYPDTSGQYGRYLREDDLAVLWEVLKAFEPARYEQIETILQDKYLYNYNILVTRKEIFLDYCNWMFPILLEVEKRLEAVQRERLPRYIGRVGEVLTSIYFSLNSEKWKIVHAEKQWRI